ncbi:MAG TPA: metallopeptidase TldD-related protein [Candidatus Binataceae bacterium]|nr:metallopeptidase TldD-related protein [Candidatus Binataceae bacterium]
MHSLNELKQFAHTASALIARDKEIAAHEVYCSSAEHRVARLNYTSDIPSRGVEELKSLNAGGFAIRIVMRRDAHEAGFAAIAGDFSPASVRDALAKARNSLLVDPHFPGLPAEPRSFSTGAAGVASDLITTGDGQIAHAAWSILAGALATFDQRAPLKLAHPGLIIGGDLSLIRDRVALASSAFADVRADENAFFLSSITALIESLEAKGTATAIGTTLAAMELVSAHLGRDAVLRALDLRHGERLAGGSYRVVLGPQPLAEIVNYVVMGSVTTGAFHAANSAFHGRFGAQVMDARLNLIDDPQAKIGPVRRRITCEGLPASPTEIIREGKLIGLLSNYYDRHRLLSDEHRAEKLGTAAAIDNLDFPPVSAYRLGEGGARRFDAHPGAAGTNVIMRTRGGVDEKELIASVRDGIYVGRVWYTYPINGQRAGDFTCTISGDSWVIRDGKLAAPLAPNCLRINANIEQIFSKPLAVGKKSEAAIVWGAPEAYFMPAIAVEGLTLSAVNPH